MSIRRMILAVAATAATGLLASCGADPNDAPNAAPEFTDGNQVIEIAMTDMAFNPAPVALSAGQTVHFWFHNDGTVIHDAAIGDLAFQDEHASAMAAGAGHEAGHDAGHDAAHGDETPALVLAPGEHGEITYTAKTAGTVLIGCHQPGHWEAGMKATINVT